MAHTTRKPALPDRLTTKSPRLELQLTDVVRVGQRRNTYDVRYRDGLLGTVEGFPGFGWRIQGYHAAGLFESPEQAARALYEECRNRGDFSPAFRAIVEA